MNKPMTAAEAKAHLSELLDRAAAGQETTITRRGKPVARVVPAANPEAPQPQRKPGRWKGLVSYDNATLWEPMTEQELQEAEGDLEEFLAMTPEQSEAYSRELRKARRRVPPRR